MVNLTDISVEAMVRKRRSILFTGLISGGLWQTTRLVEDLTHNGRVLSSFCLTVLLVVQFVSYVIWGVSIFQFFTFTKILKQNPTIAEAIADEFQQQIWLKALKLACGGAIFCQSILIAVSSFHPLTAQAGADITLLVICTTAIASFLWMERNS